MVVDFEEFLNILGLCGSIKYEEIKEMSLTQTTQAIVDNFLQRKDEKAVIGEALYPPLPRYDYANSGAGTVFESNVDRSSCSCVEGNPCVDSANCLDWKGRFTVAMDARRRKGYLGEDGPRSVQYMMG